MCPLHILLPTSDAMSSNPLHCRSFSFCTKPQTSGSLSARLSCPVQLGGGTWPGAAIAAPCCALQLQAPRGMHRCRACRGGGGAELLHLTPPELPPIPSWDAVCEGGVTRSKWDHPEVTATYRFSSRRCMHGAATCARSNLLQATSVHA